MAFDLGMRRLYLCTSDRPDLERFLAKCLEGGVDIVQLRDKSLEARPLVVRARRALAVCRDFGVPFLLNDRPDLALECGADGVHVGQDDCAPTTARLILGPDRLVGRSTHAELELTAALGEPIDYLSAGPVVPTPTKPGRPGTGIDYAATATTRSASPVFVTGGVTPTTVPDLVNAGVRRFVVVRWLTHAAAPKEAAEVLCRTLDDALERLTLTEAARATTSGGPS